MNKAACIPYYKQDNKIIMLFMKPSDPNFGGSDFQLCKGRIDPGCTSEQTAFKEALEELGVAESNIKNMEYLFFETLGYNGSSYVIFIYAAEVIDPNNLLPFHYETGDIKWFTIEEVNKELRHIHKKLVRKAYSRIQ